MSGDLKDKLASCASQEEIDGFEDQLKADGTHDSRARNLIALRRAELRKEKMIK